MLEKEPPLLLSEERILRHIGNGSLSTINRVVERREEPCYSRRWQSAGGVCVIAETIQVTFTNCEAGATCEISTSTK